MWRDDLMSLLNSPQAIEELGLPQGRVSRPLAQSGSGGREPGRARTAKRSRETGSPSTDITNEYEPSS